MSNITVGISDMQVGKIGDTVVTFALGSCVGICMYDSVLKIGALGHIMLPVSPVSGKVDKVHKFANTCVPEMVKTMIRLGCKTDRLTAKIAGGAKMFDVAGDTSFGNIGQRNIEAVKKALALFRVRIIAEDTGLNYGRTVYFDISTGTMLVKSYVSGDKSY